MAIPKLKRKFVVHFLAVALIYACASANAATEKFSAQAGTMIGGDTLINGDLTIPEGSGGKRPAVVVIHSSGGYEDTTRAPYVKALNAAGIATLELNLFANGGRPASTSMNLPHVYGALINLGNDSRIDAGRIGIMGFSHGGLLSMFSASQAVTQEYTGGKIRFAAHLPIYPVCWAHLASIEGKNPVYKQVTYQELTGAPVHILAGAKDDYDDPDTCQRFVQAVPEDQRKYLTLTVYPDATHGWDTERDKVYYDKAANKGRGTNVRHYRNAEAAAKSKAFTVEFFKSAFGPQ